MDFLNTNYREFWWIWFWFFLHTRLRLTKREANSKKKNNKAMPLWITQKCFRIWTSLYFQNTSFIKTIKKFVPFFPLTVIISGKKKKKNTDQFTWNTRYLLCIIKSVNDIIHFKPVQKALFSTLARTSTIKPCTV